MSKSPKMSSSSDMTFSVQERAALDEIELEMSIDEQFVESKNNNEPSEGAPSMDEAFLEVRKCTDLFFKNQFDEAMDIFTKFETTSLPHSMGKSFLRFLYGLLTLEPEDIRKAKEAIKVSNNLVARTRKRTSLLTSVSSLLWRTNYDDYTDEEVHAELMYADVQIMLTLLSFGEQGSIISLIKGAFRMRAANGVFKVCLDILKRRTTWQSELSKNEFESGVLMGNGTINLIISHLPARILKVLSFAGFSGDQDIAMTFLKKLTDDLKDTMRACAGQLVVMGYLLYMEQLFGVGESPDPLWADRLSANLLDKFPNGAWSLLYAGRLEQIKGHPSKAIPYFEQCLAAQSSWLNMHNICYWDLTWCQASLQNWSGAAEYSKVLKDKCLWSPATNLYQYACFLYAMMEKSEDEGERVTLRAQIDEAMAKVPDLKIRYAGKCIPPEKFAVTRALRYNEGKRDLTFPVLELFYVWNLFSNIAESSDYLEPFLVSLEATLSGLKSNMPTDGPLDKFALVLLLTGVCRRARGHGDEALECFQTILDIEDRIEEDTYLPPHAAFELGLTFAGLGHDDEATKWLEAARSDYSGFLIESSVHLRVHGALSSIKRKQKAAKKLPKNSIEKESDSTNM